MEEEPQAPTGEWGNVKPRKAEEDMVSYLQGVAGSLDSNPDPEEISMMLDNVFEEIKNKEASIATHRKASRVLEKLVAFATQEQVAVMFSNMKEYFGFLVFNRASSHVVEKVINRCASLFLAKEFALEAGTDDTLIQLRSDMVSLSEFLRNTEEYWNLAFDASATHILRTLMSALAGKEPAVSPVHKKKKKRKGNAEMASIHSQFASTGADASKASKKQSKLTTFPEFAGQLKLFLVKISELGASDLKDMAFNTYASPVMQFLLAHISSKEDAWKSTVAKLVTGETNDDDDDNNNSTGKPQFDVVITNHIASHVMEVILASSRKSFYGKLFDKYFESRFVQLSKDKIANYVVQHCISAIKTEEQLGTVLHELDVEVMTELLNIGHVGVLVRVAQVCARFPDHQKPFTKSVIKAAKAAAAGGDAKSKSASISPVKTLLRMDALAGNVNAPGSKEFGTEDQVQHTVHICGTQLVNSLLKFDAGNNRRIVEDLVSLEDKDVLRLATDPVAGRYILEPLLDAPIEFAWAKQRLVAKIRENDVALAENKFGHHVLRKAFDSATPKYKLMFVEDMNNSEKRLQGSVNATRILKHIKLEQYQHHPETWKDNITQASRKRKRMDNWLEDLK